MSQGFVDYFKGIVAEKQKAWEANILEGAFKTHEEYQKGIGISQALKSVVDGVDELHSRYTKEKEGLDS